LLEPARQVGLQIRELAMQRAVSMLGLLVLLGSAVAAYVVFQPASADSAAPAAAGHSGGAGQGGGTHAGSAGGGQAGGARAGGGNGRAAATVSVAAAQQQTLPIADAAVGFIAAPNTAVLRARADGIVVAQLVQEGQMVKAGDVLFKLDDTAAQAAIARDQAAIGRDQAVLESGQKDLTRDQALLRDQSGTQQAADQQTATVKGATAQLQIDQAQLRTDQLTLSYMSIVAPIDGRVGQINTSVGNIVRAADTSTGGLLTITQMSPLQVTFSIPERNLDEYRAALGKGGSVPVEITAPDDKAPRATAALAFIDSSIDASSGTITAKANVTSGEDKLWPGQYVNVVTQLGSYDNALTVPLIAVQQDATGSFVFAVDGSNKVRQVPVTVAATTDTEAILAKASLAAGDKVVVEGQLHLSNGTPVTPVDADAPAQPAAPTRS
jgi:multidrug efflux system membrane fusion protein